AIANRQWEQFKELETNFVSQYGVEVWQEVFNFRLKPALDKDSDRPGRSEPRVRKRRPKIYPLMTKPRHELRKQLQSA
ncbi:MAG: hypothetical protein ACYTX0_51090, partial [Nostoc sp.]